MARFAVWGCGIPQYRTIQTGDPTVDAYRLSLVRDPDWHERIGDRDYPEDDVWFVEVDADGADLDDMARFDKAVRGYGSLEPPS